MNMINAYINNRYSKTSIYMVKCPNTQSTPFPSIITKSSLFAYSATITLYAYNFFIAGSLTATFRIFMLTCYYFPP